MITPLGYEFAIQDFLDLDDVVIFVLRDTVDNIFDRLYFTDDNDNFDENSEAYKLEHAHHYWKEVKEDLKYYGNVYRKVENKIDMDGASAEETATLIYEQLVRR